MANFSSWLLPDGISDQVIKLKLPQRIWPPLLLKFLIKKCWHLLLFTLPTGKTGHLMLLKTSWLNISPGFNFEYFPFLLLKASTRISTPFQLLKTSYGIYTPLSTVEYFLSKLFTLSPQLRTSYWNVCPLSIPSYCWVTYLNISQFSTFGTSNWNI